MNLFIWFLILAAIQWTWDATKKDLERWRNEER
jgi:hypothetical protein